jgi:glyoxalase family protein
MLHRGIHHLTAIAGPARRNLDFYVGALGLRLVKKTVDFDDPGTYHLYYGDETGGPGTILTFFPWGGVAPGRLGVGETQEMVFRIPEAAIGYWTHRFIERASPTTRSSSDLANPFYPSGIRTARALRWSGSAESRGKLDGAAARFRWSTLSAASTA